MAVKLAKIYLPVYVFKVHAYNKVTIPAIIYTQIWMLPSLLIWDNNTWNILASF